MQPIIPYDSIESVANDTRNPTLIKQPTKEEDIKQTKTKLDGLIEQLNGKLVGHFRDKQQKLLEEYKQELIHAQKELNQLKANTNEEQIRVKMIARKKQLEKQRQELIQTNMMFSNKCEKYKKKLSALVLEGKELEREVSFLERQLQAANRKKLIMGNNPTPTIISISDRAEQDSEKFYKQLPGVSNSKSKQVIGTPIQQNFVKDQVSTQIKKTQGKKTLKSLSLKSSKNKKQHENSNFVKKQSNLSSKIFAKTPLQYLFQEAVESVREKRKGKATMAITRGEEFTDYEKKLIMQQFLSNESVKKKIYEVIFEQQGPPIYQSENKVRISFDDVDL